MRVDPCLLLCAAALLADSASAAEANPRPRGLNRRDQRFYPSSNSSTSAAAPTLPPPALTSLTSTELQDASRQRSSSSCTSSSSSDVDAEPAPSSPQSRSTWPPTTLPTSSLTSHQPSNASVPGSPSGPATPVSPSSPSFTDHASRNSTHAMTPPSTQPSNGTVTITTSRSRNHTTTRHPHGPVVSVTIDCPATINPSDCTGRGYLTVNYTRSDPTSTEKCTPVTDSHRPLTEFSVVYTSTITFYGNRTDYTPPYEPIRTPKYCAPTIVPAIPPGFTVSPKILTSDIAKESSRGGELVHPSTLLPFITFITTDKNPSVVYPSDPVPNYSPTWGQVGDGGPGDGSHKTVGRGGNGGGDPHKTPDADSITAAPRPTFKVTARGTQVVINDKTFAGLNPGQTSLVTVDGGTFTIYPSAVIGEGATIQKPPPPGTGVQVATPTAAVVGGLPVTLSGSHAIVGGATMTIPETASTTVIDGHSVSIGPGSLVVGGQSLSFKHVAPSRETDVVVSGGELLTAIGRSVVVIHSTTFTYGPGIPETSQVIQDDTISIGPSGVIVHGTLIGGQAAGPTATSYEIVGGATITRIAPSIAVINGKTFTVGPGTEWTTTVIAGQTWTVGPTGLVGSSMTFKYPFGTAVTTTISPTGTWLNDFPIETAGQNRGGDDDDSSGTSLRPNLLVGWTAFCIAIGVWVLA